MPKRLVIVAGPNGAGKTTFARAYLQVYAYKYLSADALAAELSPEQPSLARIEAGREFSRKVKESISAGEDLIVESTLSGRSMRQFIKVARDKPYSIMIVFVFLENAQICVDRVKERVKKGGHDVPELDIRRRFHRSKENFWEIYRHQADEWHLFYNSSQVFWQVASASAHGYEVMDEKLFSVFIRDIGTLNED
jgi:predicted ABC-type ATPase